MIHDLHEQCDICKASITISTDDSDKKYLKKAEDKIEEFKVKHKGCKERKP